MPKKKILVVDDEKDLLILLREILENEGFEVVTAESGKECLEKLKALKPDLIILDMMMPKMSGDETLKKIREDPKNKDLKAVFLTVARISEETMFNLGKLNILDYINKPFDNEELVKRIKKVV
jgi:CheY-like chemotaxis protein